MRFTVFSCLGHFPHCVIPLFSLRGSHPSQINSLGSIQVCQYSGQIWNEEKINSPALYGRVEAQSTNVVTRKNVIPYMGERYSNYFTVQSQKKLQHYINGISYKWSWKVTSTKGKLINGPERRWLQYIGIGRVWWSRKHLIKNIAIKKLPYHLLVVTGSISLSRCFQFLMFQLFQRMFGNITENLPIEAKFARQVKLDVLNFTSKHFNFNADPNFKQVDSKHEHLWKGLKISRTVYMEICPNFCC